MGEHGIAEEFGLAGAVVAPDFEHDVGAAGGAIFFDAGDAFFGCTGDGADFAKDFVGDGFGGGFAATGFHGVGDGLQVFASEAGAIEQDVRRVFDILHFVGEVHGGLFARAFLALGGIAADAADDDAAESEPRRIACDFARAFFHVRFGVGA